MVVAHQVFVSEPRYAFTKRVKRLEKSQVFFCVQIETLRCPFAGFSGCFAGEGQKGNLVWLNTFRKGLIHHVEKARGLPGSWWPEDSEHQKGGSSAGLKSGVSSSTGRVS